ncbi:MAG: GH92 family glycosyl hydrolase [Bacteroidetes bacterium]|nr:GH92 family glycosyl hydrolase [Bacteroidota bacterium]
MRFQFIIRMFLNKAYHLSLKKNILIALVLCLLQSALWFSACVGQKPEYKIRNFSQYVMPMVGTGGHGHTFPGAAYPFGMVQLSPDTRLDGWDGCSGYHHSDSLIYGFTHTHLSGTGCLDYGDILIMPFSQKYEIPNTAYASSFNHATELATPGYYSVQLNKHNIKAELTVTPRTGMHRYTYAMDNNGILIDLAHRDEVLDSWIELVNDTVIRGYRNSKSWATDQRIYFYLISSEPFDKSFIYRNDSIMDGNRLEGKNLKAALYFKNKNNKQVLFKVGISGVSCNGALLNLKTENPLWNFDKIKEQAALAWNTELSKIEIEADQQVMNNFYTAFYHCMIHPNLNNDVDGSYRGRDMNVYADKQHNLYTVFSLWDTYRALHPLLTLIDKKRTGDFINTFLHQYEEGKLLPVWELSSNETFCMIGFHSVPVIVDAYFKDVTSFDINKALAAAKQSADTTLYGRYFFNSNLYLSNAIEHESVSKTLEYSYDNWCIAQLAKRMHSMRDTPIYTKRSLSYRNLFDYKTKFIRGRDNGSWHTPFIPSEVNNYYTEANAWQYHFYVPHDITNFMKMHGGVGAFAAKLDSLFTAPMALKGRQQADITGLIGQYAHGNEPSHHMAYLFNYVGQSYKTQYYTNRICKEMYNPQPDGLCGNEDCGQMSAWYVWSALGMYPVCPGSNQYVFGSPLVNKAVINLENGEQIEINTKGDASPYWNKVTLNKKIYGSSYITYEDVKNGCQLTFNRCDSMDATKPVWNRPFSETNDSTFIEVPIFEVASRTFTDSMLVTISHPQKDIELYYMTTERPGMRMARKYTKPFYIDTTCEVNAFAKSTKGPFSAAIKGEFNELHKNRKIKIMSEYDSQYTSGGDMALIDGIHGDKEFRKGNWQGYFGKKFEAILDLGKVDTIHSVSATFLHDQSPWIMAPKIVAYEVSQDGSNFTLLEEIQNQLPDTISVPTVVKFQTTGNPIFGRFIKVNAPNFGKLPSWHLSKGENSWLFIDEIEIK